MRLFLDANVLFTAAHNPRGKAAFAIELGGKGEWELYSSFYAMEEARRNLENKYPHALKNLKTILVDIGLINHSEGIFYPQGLVEKDRPIFQAALACNATHLLTGDLKHFGYLMNNPDKTSGICVQTVSEFLATLGE